MMKKNKPQDVFKHINMMQGNQERCWPWIGSLIDERPYFTVNGKKRAAYIIVLELMTGEQAKGRVVRHTCDNPVCCNPRHLLWGSKQDNSNDMKSRERHGLSKIVVRGIKKLLDRGETHQEIADKFGISREAVTGINNERTEQSKHE